LYRRKKIIERMKERIIERRKENKSVEISENFSVKAIIFLSGEKKKNQNLFEKSRRK